MRAVAIASGPAPAAGGAGPHGARDNRRQERRAGAVDVANAAAQLAVRLSDEGFGDDADLRALLPAVYADLKRVAHRQLLRHVRGATLSTTALVHEAYSRLAEHGPPPPFSRAHFFALSARIMRQIVVDHARARAAGKRGGGASLVTLIETDAPDTSQMHALLGFVAAFDGLARADPRLARLIEQHWFLGMDTEELAVLHGTTQRTIQRELKRARAWIGDLLAP
jgi:RNA polymerase sigma factor (TIGR02999 family)